MEPGVISTKHSPLVSTVKVKEGLLIDCLGLLVTNIMKISHLPFGWGMMMTTVNIFDIVCLYRCFLLL